MTDRPDDATGAPANETPMQRALRLKQAAQQAKSQPRGDAVHRRQAANLPSGASKPWMKKS